MRSPRSTVLKYTVFKRKKKHYIFYWVSSSADTVLLWLRGVSRQGCDQTHTKSCPRATSCDRHPLGSGSMQGQAEATTAVRLPPAGLDLDRESLHYTGAASFLVKWDKGSSQT